MTVTKEQKNPLGEKPVGTLLRQFAIPSIIAMLVGSLYNVVDQFFIGQCVGTLGNTATNVVYPLTIACIAIALLFGIGAASAFNLAMGAGKVESAKYYIGNSVIGQLVGGILLATICISFMKPILVFCGTPSNAFPYAVTYLRATSLGFPFLILSAGGAHLVRADGSPKYSMYMNVTGAVINVILDTLFVYVLGWGMFGAGLATVIGQIIAAGMLFYYLARKFHTVPLDLDAFCVRGKYLKRITSLGMANCFNQCAMMVMAVVLNKSLKYYGGISNFGEDIPIAVAGIATKVMQIMMAFVIGLSQGLQPIASYNYGAGQYARVRKAYHSAMKAGACICVVAYVLFMSFPRQIIGFFGNGSDAYYTFGVLFIRLNFLFLFTYFVQPITSNFFSSIGKPQKGIFLSLTRQIIFYLPGLLLLPLEFGIHGIMYAEMLADVLAAIVNIILVVREMRRPEYQS